MKRMILAAIIAAGLSTAIYTATPPMFINYQGVLKSDSGAPKNGSFDMIFNFYTEETGGTQLLADIHSVLYAPYDQVVVTNGLFSVRLGSGTIEPHAAASLAEMFRDYQSVWMAISVDWEPLSPRVQVLSTAYAQNASSLQGAVNVDSGGNVGIGTTSPSANLDVQGTVHMFGPWAAEYCASTYAPSDGFVVCYVEADHSGDRGHIIGTVNGIRRASASVHWYNGSSIYVFHNSFIMPVRIGELYAVECYTTSGDPVFGKYWAPLGHLDGQFTESAPPDLSMSELTDTLPHPDPSAPAGTEEIWEHEDTRSGQTAPLIQRMPLKAPADKGDVLVFDPADGGGLRPCSRQADPMVVGVAAEERPCPSFPEDCILPVAVAGVVSVKADATLHPIAKGDLLVTSGHAGLAMKAATPVEPGTIIGKAIEPLESGTGLISVFVALK